MLSMLRIISKDYLRRLNSELVEAAICCGELSIDLSSLFLLIREFYGIFVLRLFWVFSFGLMLGLLGLVYIYFS